MKRTAKVTFSPGPWEVSGITWVRQKGNGEYIASVTGFDTDANISLIAAAPEMYRMLEVLEDVFVEMAGVAKQSGDKATAKLNLEAAVKIAAMLKKARGACDE
jgi:hypothetical protein